DYFTSLFLLPQLCNSTEQATRVTAVSTAATAMAALRGVLGMD
ncbi:hypothetical protein J433_03770, partial [Corynebacterium glutamicum MT]